MLEAVIAVVIVAAALTWTVIRLVRVMRGEEGCRCGSGDCRRRQVRPGRGPKMLVLLPILVAAAGQALAQSRSSAGGELEMRSEASAWWAADQLGGDLSGFRPALEPAGVSIELVSTDEYFSKRSGGVVEGEAGDYLGLLDLAVTADLERWGVPRTGVFLNLQAGHGNGLSESTVGDCQAFSNIDAGGFSQLNEYWVEHTLVGERVRLKVGRQDANADFAAVDLGAPFINSSFGVIPTVPIPTFPTPGLGVAAVVTASDRLEVAAGVFEGAPAQGSRCSLPGAGDDGALFDVEAKLAIAVNGMPATVRAGVWYHSADVVPDSAKVGDSALVGNYGAYLSADQLVWAEPGDPEQGLGTFVQLGWAPGDRNHFAGYLGGGVVYTGLLATRDRDAVGLGVAHARFSDQLPGAGTETALELFYLAIALPWLTVQPDIQYIFSPGGEADDALVVGLRLQTRF